MTDFRCKKCNKLLARYTQCQALEIKCGRCGMQNQIIQTDIPVQYAIIPPPVFIARPRSKPIPAGV
ncbi:MAG: Com family DNA-binding transcriptional regulator [Firmicutes bacterium]|nr:Com family DNA-binding transcriptional regulator [Bacillota bacterium]